ncbi:sodium-dependent glucose transporter 1C-like [Liolophura sinensis]|uniref:sodium-dependent glucose transporter 1C-like n=1 Tax=Liolophura sinensis TaxID=3198878 RepID=UPI0031585B2E
MFKGGYSSMISTSLVDFKERLAEDYDLIARAIAAKSVGVMLGAIIAGCLNDRFTKHGDLIMAGTLFIASLSVASKPWVTSIVPLGALYTVEGLAHGGMSAVGNAMCLQLWQEKANTPIHALHFGFGLGSVISPQVTRPFLSLIVRNGTLMNPNSTELEDHGLNSTSMVVLRPSRIEIPYFIVGGVVFLMGMAFVAFQFVYTSGRPGSPDVDNEDAQTTLSDVKSIFFSRSAKRLDVIILTQVFFFYFFLYGGTNPVDTFLFTYAVESDLGFTKDEAAYLDSAYWASFTVGRFISAVVAHWVSVNYMIFFEVFASAGVLAFLSFKAVETKTLLWVFSCLYSAASAPLFPSGTAWADRYIKVSGIIIAVFDVGFGVAGFIFQSLAGHLFTRYNPNSLLYLSLGSAVVLCLLMISMKLVGGCQGDRHRRQRYQNEQVKKMREFTPVPTWRTRTKFRNCHIRKLKCVDSQEIQGNAEGGS